MSIRGKAFIAGVHEHPERHLPDRTLPQIHADVALGALSDAGLSTSDVDAYYSAGDAPGFGVLSMVDYLGLDCHYINDTETGGSSYLVHAQHAATAIAAGHIDVALITLAGKPRTGDQHEFGTTSEQLAEVKVAASTHAQHNPHAFLQDVVSVEEVLDSPMISDPLHRLDCCVITDGGGAMVIVSEAVADRLARHCIPILGTGSFVKSSQSGRIDLTHTGAVRSGPLAFDEAGVTPSDIDYVSVYDSFTITVLITLEDLGFCERGAGGEFIASGALRAPHGALPFNTDGGGLCNNHPANRGGMTKVIEAVRQLRNEARAEVQVPDCELAVAHGTGGSLATRSASSTMVLGRSL